jgi:hypothetical protein
MFRPTLILASLGCSIPLLADAQATPTESLASFAPSAPASSAQVQPASSPPSATPPAPQLVTSTQGGERRRSGWTVEVNAGVGRLRTSPYGSGYDEGTGGAVAIGVGRWINDRLAIMGRASHLRYTSEDGYGYTYEPATIRQTFIGVSAQQWISDSLWGSAGVGVGQVKATSEQDLGFPLTALGFGLDLRIGITPVRWADSAFNLSFAVSPLWTNGYGELTGNESWMGLSTSLLAGFQFL